MTIRASVVRELRERTGAGMMECKKALLETNGDMDAAIAWLRKHGLSKAAKKAERVAKEGTIAVYIGPNDASMTLVEVHCETDFVAKNEQFQQFASTVAQIIGEHDFSDVAAVQGAMLDGETVLQHQTQLTMTIGENIGVGRFAKRVVQKPSERLIHYIHAGSKIGVIVQFDDPRQQLSDDVARDIAMHVAAMNPPYVTRTAVPAPLIEKEEEILRAQLADDKKPAEIVEKILQGRLNKFFAEICLDEQVFVKDPQGKRSVQQILHSVGDAIRVKDMVRLQVGTE
ncbi:MAG: elongation factor Ts [Deltaproteobacteria bacterium]|nr:elongation factor Ts [Deltaproteobacteria bacterium]